MPPGTFEGCDADPIPACAEVINGTLYSSFLIARAEETGENKLK